MKFGSEVGELFCHLANKFIGGQRLVAHSSRVLKVSRVLNGELSN